MATITKVDNGDIYRGLYVVYRDGTAVHWVEDAQGGFRPIVVDQVPDAPCDDFWRDMAVISAGLESVRPREAWGESEWVLGPSQHSACQPIQGEPA